MPDKPGNHAKLPRTIATERWPEEALNRRPFETIGSLATTTGTCTTRMSQYTRPKSLNGHASRR